MGSYTTNLVLFTLSTIVLAGRSSEKKHSKAARANPNTPKMDGILNDPAWPHIGWTNNFTQVEPEEGKSVSQRTAFKLIYDGHNLYVAIKAVDKCFNNTCLNGTENFLRKFPS